METITKLEPEATNFLIKFLNCMGNNILEVGHAELIYNGWKEVNIRQALQIIVKNLDYKRMYTESMDEILNVWIHKFRPIFSGVEELHLKQFNPRYSKFFVEKTQVLES